MNTDHQYEVVNGFLFHYVGHSKDVYIIDSGKTQHRHFEVLTKKIYSLLFSKKSTHMERRWVLVSSIESRFNSEFRLKQFIRI